MENLASKHGSTLSTPGISSRPPPGARGGYLSAENTDTETSATQTRVPPQPSPTSRAHTSRLLRHLPRAQNYKDEAEPTLTTKLTTIEPACFRTCSNQPLVPASAVRIVMKRPTSVSGPRLTLPLHNREDIMQGPPRRGCRRQACRGGTRIPSTTQTLLR